jgi:hypothetical protein
MLEECLDKTALIAVGPFHKKNKQIRSGKRIKLVDLQAVANDLVLVISNITNRVIFLIQIGIPRFDMIDKTMILGRGS